MEPAEEVRLNNQLLAAEDDQAKPKEPKRNSKESIRANILKVVEKYELDFPFSDTKLKRMNKQELTKLLADVMEQSVKIDMAKSVGVDPRADGKVVSLGALRMLHNICATGFEKTFQHFGPAWTGMTCEGFAEGLQDPTVSPVVDECLAEIAAENPDVLEYFDSPYSRLALVWFGVISTTLKKAQKRNGVRAMGPRERPVPFARGPRRRRSEEERQVDGDDGPSVQTV